jgi:hypothetical protein
MLFFVISLAVGIAAVLGAQKLDIEMLNPPAPKRPAAKPIAGARGAAAGHNAGTRAPASSGFIPGSVYLRQQ